MYRYISKTILKKLFLVISMDFKDKTTNDVYSIIKEQKSVDLNSICRKTSLSKNEIKQKLALLEDKHLIIKSRLNNSYYYKIVETSAAETWFKEYYIRLAFALLLLAATILYYVTKI